MFCSASVARKWDCIIEKTLEWSLDCTMVEKGDIGGNLAKKSQKGKYNWMLHDAYLKKKSNIISVK